MLNKSIFYHGKPHGDKTVFDESAGRFTIFAMTILAGFTPNIVNALLMTTLYPLRDTEDAVAIYPLARRQPHSPTLAHGDGFVRLTSSKATLLVMLFALCNKALGNQKTRIGEVE